MTNSRVFIAICAFLLLIAMWRCDAAGTSCAMSPTADCSASAVRQGKVQLNCITKDGTALGAGCTNDTCASLQTSGACVNVPGCSPLAVAPTAASPTQCVNSQLFCWSLNQTSCGNRKYCKWVSGATNASSYCNYSYPSVAPAIAYAQSQQTCPALHPAVLAILIVMFVSLVAAIVVVAVVVFMNKKKQDEIDREEEEAEAEAAVGRI